MTAIADIDSTYYASIKCGDSIASEVGRLIVTQTTLSDEAWSDGERVVTGFVATQDGRGLLGEWHRGPEAPDLVYFERHEIGRHARQWTRTMHGWLDPVTRGITQTG